MKLKKLLALALALLMLFALTACTAEDVDLALDVLDMVSDAASQEPAKPYAPPEDLWPDSQAPPADNEAPPAPDATGAPVTLPADPNAAGQAPDQQPIPPVQAPADSPAPATEAPTEPAPALPEDGQYDDKDNVALYIHLYGKLPSNYMSKNKAEDRYGWTGGALSKLAPGMAIGGSRFGNYEGILPDAPGREWTECDIDTVGKSSRGAKRIVFSNDGLIYYTDDHYETFECLYGGE